MFIARDNPNAGDELETAIYEACELLARNPRLGHKRTDLTDEPVLFWPVRGNYLVIYLRDKQPLFIARILHAARDVKQQIG